jgi:hypothetical protein
MSVFVDVIYINEDNKFYKIDHNNKPLIDIREKLTGLTCIYPDEQIWFCNGKIIDDNYLNWDINNNYYILVDNKWHTLYIKNTIGKKIKLPMVKTNTKIKDIKLLIFSLQKIIPDNFNLIYRGKVLNDDDILSDYKIKTYSTINMSIKLKSGFI